MKFEVKTDLTKQDFEAYYQLNQKVHAPAAFMVNKYGGIAGVILAVVLTIVILAYRLWTSKSVMIPYCIFMVLLIALPFVNRWLLNRMYEASRSSLKAEYRFGDSGVESTTETSKNVYTWFAFCELYHSGAYYYLYVDKAHAIVLPERSFTQGEPAAFGPFIAEKTGLEVKEIK